MSAMYTWLTVGVLFLAVEAFGMPGAGLLFAGLGALVAGSSIYLGIVAEQDSLMQFIVFFVSSGMWTGILWKPLKKFRVEHKKHQFSNMTGETAVVTKKGLNADGGEVRWSGTIMSAKLADDAVGAILAEGARVTIVDVAGTTLIVKPK